MNIKGKTKTQKGITLVALIITIVILIILAVVSIGIISKEEIFRQAEDATIKYNESVPKEQNTLAGYVDKLNEYLVGSENGDGSGGTTSREGQTVQYDSNNDGKDEDWIILTDRNGLVEIVSAQPMGSLKLGAEDTTVKVTTDLDGNGIVNNIDKCIASYNNAITTINNYCKSLVTATDNEGVRSVGGTNNDYTAYHSTNYDTWGSKITVDVAAPDEYYKTDYEKMEELGIAICNKDYWIASRGVEEGASYESFYVRVMYSWLNGHTVWNLSSNSSVSQRLS